MFTLNAFVVIMVGMIIAALPLTGNEYLFPKTGDPMLAISLVSSMLAGIIYSLRKEIDTQRFSLPIYFFFGSCLLLMIVGFFLNGWIPAMLQVPMALLCGYLARKFMPENQQMAIRAAANRTIR